MSEWVGHGLPAESPKKKKSSKSKHRSRTSRDGSLPLEGERGGDQEPITMGTGGGVNGIVASPEKEEAAVSEGE